MQEFKNRAFFFAASAWASVFIEPSASEKFLAAFCAMSRSYGYCQKDSKTADDDVVYAFASFASFELSFHFLQSFNFACFFRFDDCHNSKKM